MDFWVVSEILCREKFEEYFFFNDKFLSLCRIRIDNERNQVYNIVHTQQGCVISSFHKFFIHIAQADEL